MIGIVFAAAMVAPVGNNVTPEGAARLQIIGGFAEIAGACVGREGSYKQQITDLISGKFRLHPADEKFRPAITMMMQAVYEDGKKIEDGKRLTQASCLKMFGEDNAKMGPQGANFDDKMSPD